MARVFLLGASGWDPARREPRPLNPMDLRREMLTIFAGAGHDAFVMEDEPDRGGEDLVDKFDRLLREKRVTDIVVLWPKGVKMQTTFDELLLLRDRVRTVAMLRVWILHEEGVAKIGPGYFEILEEGGRSRYLGAVRRLGVRPIEWSDLDGLRQKTQLLAREL